MYTKKNVFLAIFSFLILAILILFGTYYYTLNKQKILLDSIYDSANTSILKLTENSLSNKTNTVIPPTLIKHILRIILNISSCLP